MSIFEQDAVYLLADPDIVEAKNLRNQLFIEQDIGKKKAEVLANIYSAAYNLKISYYTNSYIENVETLTSLFSYDYLDIGYRRGTVYTNNYRLY